jgi:hypothetical protein
VCLLFVINNNINLAFQWKLTEIATLLPTNTGQFCLLSYWLVGGYLGIASGFPIAQRLSNSRWAFPSGFSITFLAVSNGCPADFKSFSQRLSAKTWHFPSLFSEWQRFR